MYIPGTFLETDTKALTGLIGRYPLGLLVTSGASGLLASPIPFLYRENEGKPALIAHLAKANPHWKDLVGLKECLVVFQGADGYVTPDWYPSKQTNHKVVPTWNYEMVQVNGVPTVIESTDWLRKQVGEVTDSMEAKRKSPWSVIDAPTDFIESQLNAIVGLEIQITDIKGKWKMSQNRTSEDAQGVVSGMSDPSDPHFNSVVAEIVRSKNSPK
jgi:transcriptional regulator